VVGGDYEVMGALKEGAVRPDGIDLKVVRGRDSPTRHWRFLRGGEFDVGEVSSSSYVAARDNGHPFHAIPVFPHRRFRHGFAYINTGKGIKTPKDLIGKKVGVKFFLNSAALWLRGILEHEYGVPFKSIEWYSELDEDIAEASFPKDIKLSRVPPSKSIVGMLVDGELDALLHPDLIDPLREKDPRVGRLFPDYKADEAAYFKKTGIYPIMHVIALRRDVYAAHPWVAGALMKAFVAAKAIAYDELRVTASLATMLPWQTAAVEEAIREMGPDWWSYGLQGNEAVLDAFLRYHHEQGLSGRRLQPHELFAHETLEAFKI